jgi:DNA processing protein
MPLDDSERLARMGLAAAWEPGDRRVADLVGQFGAEAVWDRLRTGEPASDLERRAQSTDLDEVRRQTRLLRLRFIVPGDDEWPPGLEDLGRPGGDDLGGAPLGLWLAGPGHAGQLGPQAVAIVGSRASTAYGEHAAADLAAGVAEQGRIVVSGGAYGIDAAAHRAAMAVGGRTVAFMAGGLAMLYPPGNSQLLERIRADHLIVSEHPPDRTPSRWRFLARNRLIAAVTGVTVVVEAGARSGAANTAKWAQSLGRPLAAVPGPVTSALSFTPHRLIRDSQAVLVTTPEEIAALAGPLAAEAEPMLPLVPQTLDGFSFAERRIHEVFPARAQTSADDLACKTGFTILEVLTALGRLREAGLVDRTERGTWRLARPAVQAAA